LPPLAARAERAVPGEASTEVEEGLIDGTLARGQS
jgi:hypothetical protein